MKAFIMRICVLYDFATFNSSPWSSVKLRLDASYASPALWRILATSVPSAIVSERDLGIINANTTPSFRKD